MKEELTTKEARRHRHRSSFVTDQIGRAGVP